MRRSHTINTKRFTEQEEREFVRKLDETIRLGAEHSARLLGRSSTIRWGIMPDSMRLTPEEQAELDSIRVKAKERHRLERNAAKARGRKHYPDFPYECSWAYEQEFMRASRG